MENENLGDFVYGDRLESSPYKIQMKNDVYCEQICISNVGRKESKGISPNKIVRAIRKQYQHNWVVDNLPSISEMKVANKDKPDHFIGFPLGLVYQNKAYINNHVNIHLEYHLVDDAESSLDEYRIMKFTIEPLSIGHTFKHTSTADDDAGIHKKLLGKKRVAKIKNPIPSCDYSLSDPLRRHKHTNLEMVSNGPGLQPASHNVLFTYDVIWKENKDTSWSSRWDLYLDLNSHNEEVAHWFSITNSLMVVIFISLVIAWILLHNLQQDYERYCGQSYDEELMEDDCLKIGNSGWNQIYADIFRPPPYPLELSVLCGTGVQLFCMSSLTAAFVMLGTFSPDEHETLALVFVLLYVVMGGISGYVMGYLYKTLDGKSWQKATTILSLGFPSFVFVITCLMNALAIRQSNESISYVSLVCFLLLWLGISTPLVFLGSHFGYKVDGIEFPVNTMTTPRQIPRQPCYTSSIVTISIGSLVPFGACFIEVSTLMASLWIDEYYYVFGFLYLTLLCLLVISVEITILLTYVQLSHEDYRWWWRSFITGASVAVYIFIYAVYYSTKLESSNPVSYLFYFGYMLLISVGISIISGTVGFWGSLLFNHKLFKVYVSKSLKMS